jgi:hypothetical protein
VGDETIQFASRFSIAVTLLGELGRDETHAALLRTHGTNLPNVVRGALDAVAAVYGTGTDAVRNWPEQRQRVLAQLGAVRKRIERAGIDGEVRRMARALVDLIEPRVT